MNTFRLPAISRTNGNGSAAVSTSASPMHQRLQAALAKIVTPDEIEAIVRQILEEAKSGTAAEKRSARQILLGMLGGKQPAAPQYVQQNFYPQGGAKRRGKAAESEEVVGLVARYLETEGPAAAEVIAAAIARPAKAVTGALKANRNLFCRKPDGGGMAWDLVRS